MLVGILLYRLDGQGTGVLFLAGIKDFYLLHSIHTSTGAHPTSYIMGTRGSFPAGKEPGMKLTTHLHLVLGSRMVELYLHPPCVFMAWYLIN
jgi:hypothetical protein